MNVEDKTHMPIFFIARRLITLVCLLLIFYNGQAQVEITDSLKTDSLQNTKIEIINTNSTERVQSNNSSDTSRITSKKKKSPAKAALFSTILPGLGQAYNGKFWKIPIIYTAFATVYFFADDYNQRYLEYREAYIKFDSDDKPEWIEGLPYTKSGLKDQKDFYKRSRDLIIILGAALYLMNILDANVDAHLMDFDVSDDLSLRIEPELKLLHANQKNQNISAFGIKFVLSLHR